MFKTPVSALVLIHTVDLQVLIMERADKAGFWQSVTGSLEAGETPRQTAIREVLEETGLNAEQYELQDWQVANTYEIYPHWRYRYAPGVTSNVEHQFAWVDWREAAQRVFSWTNVDAIKRLAEHHQLSL